MIKAPDDPRSLLPLSSSSFYILLTLAEGQHHGYSIAKELEISTGGTVRLGPGTLYRLLRQMVADGWIKEVESEGDERRRCYRLTKWGRRVAVAEAERLSEVVRMAQLRQLIPTRAGA